MDDWELAARRTILPPSSSIHPASLMTVRLRRLDDAFHFAGTTDDGVETRFDISEAEGGTNQAPGPMQTVAMALGACAGIDVVLILKKQRQQLDALDVAIDYDRATDQVPAVFTRLHVHFTLTGATLDARKVQRAIGLGVFKYCSVAAMLEKTATITASCSVNGQHFEVER